MNTRSVAWIALLLTTAVELVGEAWHSPALIGATKPWLMPWLAVIVAQAAVPDLVRSRLYTFLAASWVGDVALMLAPEHANDHEFLGLPKAPVWFLIGVLGFATAHLTLIRLYRDVTHPEVPGPFPARAAWFAPLVVYGLALLSWVMPAVLADPERSVAAVPVALYGGLLHTMVAFAAQRYGRVNPASFALTLAGAVTFLVSDSCIGVVHLVMHGALPYGGLLIMTTYIAAQALIVTGLLRQHE